MKIVKKKASKLKGDETLVIFGKECQISSIQHIATNTDGHFECAIQCDVGYLRLNAEDEVDIIKKKQPLKVGDEFIDSDGDIWDCVCVDPPIIKHNTIFTEIEEYKGTFNYEYVSACESWNFNEK